MLQCPHAADPWGEGIAKRAHRGFQCHDRQLPVVAEMLGETDPVAVEVVFHHCHGLRPFIAVVAPTLRELSRGPVNG